MPTLGTDLKRQREERGITLSQISGATRIGTRFLKAIEEDNFSVLPGGIFTRSFIRAYAKQVGMNEEEAVDLYHKQIAPPPVEELLESAIQPAKLEIVSTTNTPADQPATRTRWATIAAAAGTFVLVSVVVVALVNRLNRTGGETGPKAASQSSKPVATPAPASQSAQQSQSPAAGSTVLVDRGQPISISASPDQLGGNKIVIRVEATTGDSWIRYQIDDNKSAAMMLKAGLAQNLPPAENQIKLNIGNRNTLKLTINNRLATFPPGTPNFAAQVTVSRDNLQSYLQ